MHVGSWMWRKTLKLSDVAKSFYRKELGNGRHTSFWYADLLGERGIIDMGIKRGAMIEEAFSNTRRRRRHRT